MNSNLFETLEEFDRNVAKAVIDAFPEWGELVTVEEYEGEHAFVLTVTPPSLNVRHPLRIDTFRREVTVSFEYYHAHFDEFADGTDQDAVTFVKKIVSNNCAVVSYWRDDTWCGSTVLDQGDLPLTNEEFPFANRIHIRSWTGLLDNDITCTPRG